MNNLQIMFLVITELIAYLAAQVTWPAAMPVHQSDAPSPNFNHACQRQTVHEQIGVARHRVDGRDLRQLIQHPPRVDVARVQNSINAAKDFKHARRQNLEALRDVGVGDDAESGHERSGAANRLLAGEQRADVLLGLRAGTEVDAEQSQRIRRVNVLDDIVEKDRFAGFHAQPLEGKVIEA